MITAQKCNIKMKKCKILPFQNHQFNKNSVFGPFFVDYPLLPADMINFLLNTVSTISFAPEKVVRTWGEPQKSHFSPMFGRYLKSAKIWCLRERNCWASQMMLKKHSDDQKLLG